jgi:hypothetical protein
MLDDSVNDIAFINLHDVDNDNKLYDKLNIDSNIILSQYKRIGRRKRNKTRQQRKFQG